MSKGCFFFSSFLLMILFCPTGWVLILKIFCTLLPSLTFYAFFGPWKRVCCGRWLFLAACIQWIYSDLGWLLCVCCFVCLIMSNSFLCSCGAFSLILVGFYMCHPSPWLPQWGHHDPPLNARQKCWVPSHQVNWTINQHLFSTYLCNVLLGFQDIQPLVAPLPRIHKRSL